MEEDSQINIIQTVFNIDKNRSYCFDVDETSNFNSLKKILASAAHIPKNSFRIFHEGQDYTKNFETCTLQEIFPDKKTIIFDLSLAENLNEIDENENEQISIQFNINTPCSTHLGKFAMLYCFNCKKSICMECKNLSIHDGHLIKEKADYLVPAKLLMERIFSNSSLYKTDPRESCYMKCVNYRNILKIEKFDKLRQMLDQLETKIAQCLEFFCFSENNTKENCDQNIDRLKTFCTEGFVRLKNDINTKGIIINDDVFLNLYNKLKEVEKYEHETLNENLNKYKCINTFLDPFIEEIDKLYEGISATLNGYLVKDVYENFNKKVNENIVNLIEKDQVLDFMFENITVPRKSVNRSSLLKNRNSHNKSAFSNRYKKNPFELAKELANKNSGYSYNKAKEGLNSLNPNMKEKEDISSLVNFSLPGSNQKAKTAIDPESYKKTLEEKRSEFFNFSSFNNNNSNNFMNPFISKDKKFISQGFNLGDKKLYTNEEVKVNLPLDERNQKQRKNEENNFMINVHHSEQSSDIKGGIGNQVNNTQLFSGKLVDILSKEIQKESNNQSLNPLSTKNELLPTSLLENKTSSLFEKDEKTQAIFNKENNQNHSLFEAKQQNQAQPLTSSFQPDQQNTHNVDYNIIYPLFGTNQIKRAITKSDVELVQINFSSSSPLFSQNTTSSSSIPITVFPKGGAYCHDPEFFNYTGGEEIAKDAGKFFARIKLKDISNSQNIIFMEKMLFSHFNHSMIYYNNQIFVIGGYNSKKCEIFELGLNKRNSNIWIEISELNEVRQRAMLLVENNYLYAFMGINQNSISDSIERINLNNLFNDNNKWENVFIYNPEGLNLKFYGAGIYKAKGLNSNENCYYFIGGKTENKGEENDYKKSIFEFEFSSKKFIPALFSLDSELYFIENQLYDYKEENECGNFIDIDQGFLVSMNLNV